MTLNWSSQYAPVDGDFSDVSLLLLGEGTNGSTTITDSSSNNLSVSAVDNAQISTAVNTPFGTGDGVLAFDGTGDYLQLPVTPDLTMGAGDFTIECWINLSATGAFDGVITEMRSSGATATGFVFNTRQVTTPSSGFKLNFYTSGASNLGNSILAYNQWHHLALSRSGSIVRLFANGTLDRIPFTNSSNFSDNPSVTIGQSLLYPSSNITGYISNLRITKGVARYTSNFTPPTAPFPILSPSTRIEVGDGFDVEAANYILAVEAADNQALEDSVRTAINTFVVGCKSDGIWNAIKSSCIMAGARTLDGALVPLKGGAPTNNNFVAGNYNRKTGLVGDGSTKYLSSNYAFNSGNQNNAHVSVYIEEQESLKAAEFIGNGTTSALTRAGNATDYIARLNGTGFGTVISSALGLLASSRNNSTTFDFRVGQSTTTVFASSSSVNTNQFTVYDAGQATRRTNARLSFYSIGESLDLALLDNRISTLMTTLNTVLP